MYVKNEELATGDFERHQPFKGNIYLFIYCKQAQSNECNWQNQCFLQKMR